MGMRDKAKAREWFQKKYADPEYRAMHLARQRANYHADVDSSKRKYSRSPRGKSVVKAATILRRYGLTMDQYDDMVAKADGVCQICGERPKRLVMDHCHVTNVPRGLVCDLCNRAIAVIENSDLVERVRKYLERI